MISQILLQNYHLLQESENPALRDVLIDLQKAIAEAELTDLEKQIIQASYVDPPEIPIRTGKRGKPKGAGSIRSAVPRIIHLLPQEPRLRHYQIRRDTEYNYLERSIYWFKRVRDRALFKIEQKLQYEDLDGLSQAPLRSMHKRYSSKVSVM